MTSERNFPILLLMIPTLARAGCLHRPSPSATLTSLSSRVISSSPISSDPVSVSVTLASTGTSTDPSPSTTSVLSGDSTSTTASFSSAQTSVSIISTSYSSVAVETTSSVSITSTTEQSASLTVVSSCPTPTLSDSSPLPCVVDLSESECDSLNDPNAAEDLYSFIDEANYCKSFLANVGLGSYTNGCFPSSYSYSSDPVAIYNCIISAPIFCIFTTPTCTTATYTAGNEPTQAATTYTNQLSNPTFSTGDLTSWAPLNAGTTSGISADYSHGGSPSYSFKISLPGSALGQGSSTSSYIKQAQNVYPSGTYEISYWYRHTTAGLSCSTYATVTNDVGMTTSYVDLSSKAIDTWLYASQQIQMSASFGYFQIGAYCLIYGETSEAFILTISVLSGSLSVTG